MKKLHKWSLVVYGKGMKSYPVKCGDYFINHERRIPILSNQYFMESKAVFFSLGSYTSAPKARAIAPLSVMTNYRQF